MLSFDVTKPAMAIVTAACMIATGAVLTSCQVRPLYSQAQSGGHTLSQVSFAPATDRLSQLVRNNLIFMAGNGSGESQNPAYELELTNVTSGNGEVLTEASGSILPARMTFSATYALKRTQDGSLLQGKTISVVSLFDLPQQQFAKIRAMRDAEERSAKEAAEQIRADLAIYFGTRG